MTRLVYNIEDCVEAAGAALATNCLNDILKSTSQAASVRSLMAALGDLQKLPYAERAAAGFACALINTLEVGLMNLPKGGDHEFA